MTKMAVYLEANVILGSSLSPNNYCICKSTAIANGADVDKINSIVINAPGNRLLPVSAILVNLSSVNTYTIRFLDWDGTVLKTETVTEGSMPTPPTNPTRSGYTFIGWSPTLSNATKNQDYTANYTLGDIKYNITFAEGRKYASGIYFVMNDDSIIAIENKDLINSADVKGVGYISVTSSDSFIIDTTDSSSMQFANLTQLDGSNKSTMYITSLGRDGFTTTDLIKLNLGESTSSVLNWCNERGTGWYIPSLYELMSILDLLDKVNEGLKFIGADPILCTIVRRNQNDHVDHSLVNMKNTYWTCTYADENLQRIRTLSPLKEEIVIHELDPVTGLDVEKTVISWDFYNDDTHITYSNKLRLIKHVDIAAPIVPTGTIYETMVVNPGVVPQPTVTPSKTDYTFNGWTPLLYPANKDEVYAAEFVSLGDLGETGSSGTFGFGTDTDAGGAHNRGSLLEITSHNSTNFPATITLSVSGTKYTYDSSTQSPKSAGSFSGTITLKNWNAGNATCSSNIGNGISVTMQGSAGYWGAYIMDSGGMNGPSSGTWYIMTISTSDVPITGFYYEEAEGNSSYGYYSRLVLGNTAM